MYAVSSRYYLIFGACVEYFWFSWSSVRNICIVFAWYLWGYSADHFFTTLVVCVAIYTVFEIWYFTMREFHCYTKTTHMSHVSRKYHICTHTYVCTLYRSNKIYHTQYNIFNMYRRHSPHIITIYSKHPPALLR